MDIKLVESAALAADLRAEILAICNRAFEKDLGPLLDTFSDGVHVIGTLEGAVVSHAMWVTRWLQAGDGPLLRTAYVEMVATDPEFQGRGYATAVIERLAEGIADFDLGGLSPADTTLYSGLGWEFWCGPLFIRTDDGLLFIPDEKAMILRLERTPELDLNVPLSAEWREGELW